MIGDAYEFYPCMVDGEPASIYVNLKYEHGAEPGTDTVYWLDVRMADAGPYGIGTADEGEELSAFEEAAIASVGAVGLVYVGRLRTRGIWETTFYGPAGHIDAVRAAAHELVGHVVEVRSERDAEWSYYRELLLPDAERKQWMDDRRLVQILKEQGDALTPPRRVDHVAYFTDPGARDAFIEAVRRNGFEVELEDSDSEHGVRVHRADPIELEHIHEVVMMLVDAAEEHGGRYDGWKTAIERR
jgi:hypothetical protein